MTAPLPSVEVAYRSPVDSHRACSLARSLGLACAGPDDPTGADLSVLVEEGGVWLRDNRQRGSRLLRADFETVESPSRKQPLGRAVGHRIRTVVDATAGWGDDSRRLCAMGYTVTAVERSPVLAALLEDAASRARDAGKRHVPRIIAGDAIEVLAASSGSWDCVYLDPMFPPKPRSSTLAKRPMRLLRELVGDDPDRHRLFEVAAVAAARRIVVKRPDHAAPVFGKPDDVMGGKLVCYDVYHFPR